MKVLVNYIVILCVTQAEREKNLTNKRIMKVIFIILWTYDRRSSAYSRRWLYSMKLLFCFFDFFFSTNNVQYECESLPPLIIHLEIKMYFRGTWNFFFCIWRLSNLLNSDDFIDENYEQTLKAFVYNKPYFMYILIPNVF